MAPVQQRLGVARLPDGAQLALATAGSGPPLLFIGGWLSHLELSWALPAERRLLEGLAQGRTLIRYDRLGCGLSDRPDRVDASLAGELDAVDAVLRAAGSAAEDTGDTGDRIDIVASSLGVPVAIEWAARHPASVHRLVLYGGWACGAEIADGPVRDHVVGLVRGHWGLGSEVLTEIFAPDAGAGTRAAIADYQRHAAHADTAAALLELSYRVDVTASLGRISAPTLVVHREHDRAAPVAQAQVVAAGIPSAQLLVLPGRSHLPYIGDVDALVRAVRSFLGLPALRRSASVRLTARQQEVAALVAGGLTNREIGARLGIDERSAEGHVERIRLRLGVRSRAQVAAWWAAYED